MIICARMIAHAQSKSFAIICKLQTRKGHRVTQKDRIDIDVQLGSQCWSCFIASSFQVFHHVRSTSSLCIRVKNIVPRLFDQSSALPVELRRMGTC